MSHLIDLFYPQAETHLYMPWQVPEPSPSITTRVIDFLGRDLPHYFGKHFPSFLTPKPPIPFDDEANYLVSAEEQKDLELHLKNWNFAGVYEHEKFPNKIFKGASLSQTSGLRRVETTGCGLLPLRWESGHDIAARVPMANRMRKAIEKNNLHLLYVPNKKLVKIQNKWNMKGMIVVAEKLPIMKEEAAKAYLSSLPANIKKTLFTQIFTLCIETGCSDLKFGENTTFIDSKDEIKKLAFIDTEPFGIDRLLHKSLRPSNASCNNGHSKELLTPRNIYLIGGERNAELALGMTLCELFLHNELSFLDEEDWKIARSALSAVSRRGNCEYVSNLIKSWSLRLLAPAAAITSAFGLYYSMQNNDQL